MMPASWRQMLVWEHGFIDLANDRQGCCSGLRRADKIRISCDVDDDAALLECIWIELNRDERIDLGPLSAAVTPLGNRGASTQ